MVNKIRKHKKYIQRKIKLKERKMKKQEKQENKDVTKEELIQMDKNPTNCITIDVEQKYNNEQNKKPTNIETDVKPLSSTLFGKPIILLPTSEYNQMVVKLKEYDKLKDASNRAAILYENIIKKYKEQIEALQKYEHRYKDLRDSLENTLTQFK